MSKVNIKRISKRYIISCRKIAEHSKFLITVVVFLEVAYVLKCLVTEHAFGAARLSASVEKFFAQRSCICKPLNSLVPTLQVMHV